MGNSTSSPPSYDSPSNLAAKLAKEQPTLIAFLSPSCGLCRSLALELAEVEASGIQVAKINSLDAASWAPELLAYDVEAVPCFVLLDSQGYALGKSTGPLTKPHMKSALDAMASKAR